MPYKIYTYEDPYRLNEADFWDAISALPHFCASRTLVNGLKENMQYSIHGLICPLDDLINNEHVYGGWTNNISARIHQYTILTALFKRLLDNGRLDEDFYLSLTQNQSHFLDAIRLFIELGIPAASLDSTTGNREQRLFVYILSQLQNHPAFHFPDTPNVQKMGSVFLELARKERSDYLDHTPSGSEKTLHWYDNCIKTTESAHIDTIVIHGVHQFSAAQLRLITSLDQQGMTIIFIFNYQKKFPQMYSSWCNIYRCFGVPITADSVVKEYVTSSMQTPSNALACALGQLFEDQLSSDRACLLQWHALYKSIPFVEFANITEYAHFVSDYVDAAKQKCREKQSVDERSSHKPSQVQVLHAMTENVYSANRDIHTLLKIYYPEYTKDRHFLSYPIGQFFSALYKLWDPNAGAIKMDIPGLKECLFSNVLHSGEGNVLLRTFCNLEILFEELSTYEDFRRHIVKGYLENYSRIANAKVTGTEQSLKNLSIYNRYLVPKPDLEALVKAIEEINEIAESLFATDNCQEGYINFGKHFEKLEKFLKQRELTMASKEERQLIDKLQLRLDKVKPEQSRFSGTFNDLKQGLYFYLKQQDNYEDPNWIVKNFEQIDGDILQSKKQFQREEHKTYHFACLSDNDMNKSVDQLLPWPLTDHFIQMAYAPVDLQFQVYYSTLEERSSFLRYALFYGAFFNRCDIRLSYVKQYGEDLTEPYTPLLLLGLTPSSETFTSASTHPQYGLNISKEVVKSPSYNKFQMMDMFLCPYRYLMDYVLEDSPIIRDSFLYQKFYENLLIEAVWKRISEQPRNQAQKYLNRIIDQESSGLEPYFSYWKQTEIIDLKTRAANYLRHNVIESGSGDRVGKYNPDHMQIRKLFGVALFDIDITEVNPIHPYKEFENCTKQNSQRKVYSLHYFDFANKNQQSQLTDGLRKYINETQSADVSAISGPWCGNCVHRGICVEPYLAGI